MPELSSQLLLDILLGFIILLFAAFGARRGVGREALVSAGLLLAAVIIGEWGERGGKWISGMFGLDNGTATFAVELAALLLGTFLVGYGSGGAIASRRPSFISRIAGAILAAVNGTIFLGYLLRMIDQNLKPGPALDDGFLTGILLHHFDLVLLAAA
ncbi:MAG: CvpA family protein, partial [Thermomicrobiales bacterium]